MGDDCGSRRGGGGFGLTTLNPALSQRERGRNYWNLEHPQVERLAVEAAARVHHDAGGAQQRNQLVGLLRLNGEQSVPASSNRLLTNAAALQQAQFTGSDCAEPPQPPLLCQLL